MKVSFYFASLFMISAGLSLAVPIDSLQKRQDRPPPPDFKLLVKDTANAEVGKRQDRPPPPDERAEISERQDRPPPPDKRAEISERQDRPPTPPPLTKGPTSLRDRIARHHLTKEPT